MSEIFQKAKAIKTVLQSTDLKTINDILKQYSERLIAQYDQILLENQKDLTLMEKSNPKYDRLLLNYDRIKAIANDVLRIAEYNFNSHSILETISRPNGLSIEKTRTPMGVVGIIYESRPNVTVDSISLCLKSQNICILKGSKEAEFSNKILVDIMHDILIKNNLPIEFITLLPIERAATMELIQAKGFVDVIIPRGSSSLIEFVTQNSRVPVIETGAGVVHIYVDKSAKIDMASEIIFNAKTRRPSVCNSLDCLIIHKDELSNLADILRKTIDFGTVIYADEKSYKILSVVPEFIKKNAIKKADNTHFGLEFLSLQMSIKTIENIDEVLEHIAKYSSNHSEAIISENSENVAKFLQNVDSSTVYYNTSTAFTDGGEFGMVSEIGISTQKLHTRGPFSLDALTTYKWIVRSSGSVR